MTTLTALPLVTKLSNKVIRILGCNPGPMTLQGTNTYLVGTGPRRILIDTGDSETSTAYVKLLNDVLDSEKAIIEHMIITHWHHDHIGGVRSVQELLKKRNFQSTVWKLPRSVQDRNISGEERVVQWESLTDDQTMMTEGANLKIKHTPGHTTDHVCIMLEGDEILFSGDCILGEGTAVFEDLHDYMMSLKMILAIEPREIYPGHGPVLSNPTPHIKYYIEHRQQRENEILRVLQEQKSNDPLSEMEIVEHIYKETPKNLWPAAAINVGHHLQKLLKEGKVMGHPGEWSRYEEKK